MFKKSYTIQTKSPLSGSDRKKFKKKISQCLSLTPEQIAEILPSKCVIAFDKLTNKALVYSVIIEDEKEDAEKPKVREPLFFNPTGKQNDAIYPTVYFAWKYPKVLPSVYIQAPVCKPIFRGADLFLQGVYPDPISDLKNVRKGDARQIRVLGNPACIAVGKMLCDSQHIEFSGMAGRAMKVFHWYTDCLWNHADPTSVPNDGFLADEVIKIEDSFLDENDEFYSDEDEEKHVHEENSLEADGSKEKKEYEELPADSETDKSVDEPPVLQTPDQILVLCFLEALHSQTTDDALPLSASTFYDSMKALNSSVDVKKTTYKKLAKFINAMARTNIISTVQKKGKLNITGVNREHDDYVKFSPPENPEKEETSDAEEDIKLIDVKSHVEVEDVSSSSAPGMTMDELLDHCLCVALKTRITEVMLPISASVLYSDHILPTAVSMNQRLELKQTKHKKFGKYLKACAKTKILKIKDYRNVTNVISINLEHPKLKAIAPVPVQEQPEVKKDETVSDRFGRVSVLKMYKPGGRLKRFFRTEQSNVLYSMGDAKKLLSKYIVEEELRSKEDPRFVRMDPVLYNAFYKPRKGQAQEQVPEHVTIKELSRRFGLEMHLYTAIVLDNDKPRFRRGDCSKIEIKVEKRGGGKKYVTKVINLDAYGLDPEEVAQMAKKRYACSTTIGDVKGLKNMTLKELMVQGDVSIDLREQIISNQMYAIPQRFVEIVKAVKKKKTIPGLK